VAGGELIVMREGGGGGGGGAYRVWVGKLRERDHLEDSVVDERIILRWIFRKWNGGMDWIDLALHRDRWRASVEAVLNLRVP
jgi:hypothetical protein